QHLWRPSTWSLPRRLPSALTRAKPASRSTLSCCETADFVIPNSAPTTSTTSPEERSPPASSSTMRRLTGSPSTANGCKARLLPPFAPGGRLRHAAHRRPAGVEGAGRLGGGHGGGLGGAGRDVGPAPRLRRAAVDVQRLRRRGPALLGLGRPLRRRVGQVPRQAHEAEVPAHAHGAGSEPVG